MAQSDLIPMSERSKEEVKEIASRGGVNSGKARREKKKMKEQLQLLLSLDIKSKKTRATLEGLGINKGDLNNQMVLLVKLYQLAAEGNLGAFDRIQAISEGIPKQSIEIDDKRKNPFEGMTTEELRGLLEDDGLTEGES